MVKPNSSMTVAQMKAYIREKKVNHPEVRLGMKRGDMIAGLKKAGHWDDSKSEKKPPKTKNPAKKTPAKKKAVPKGSHRMPDGSIMKDSDMPKKAPAKNESPQRQETTKATVTDALLNMGGDMSAMILSYTLEAKKNKLKQQLFETPLFIARQGLEIALNRIKMRVARVNSKSITQIADIIYDHLNTQQQEIVVTFMLEYMGKYKTRISGELQATKDRFQVGKSVRIIDRPNDKATITSGIIISADDKGIVVANESGKVSNTRLPHTARSAEEATKRGDRSGSREAIIWTRDTNFKIKNKKIPWGTIDANAFGGKRGRIAIVKDAPSSPAYEIGGHRLGENIYS